MASTRGQALRRMTAAWVAVCLGLGAVAWGQVPGVPGEPAPRRSLRLAFGGVDTSRPALVKLEDARGHGAARLVVQFDGPLTDRERADLRDRGLTLVQYLGDGAYIARADPGARGVPARAAWMGRFDRAWKRAGVRAGREFQTRERQELARRAMTPVVVTLFADASAEEVADVMAALGRSPGAEVYWRDLVGGNITVSALVPGGSLEGLSALDAVQFIEDAPELTERNLDTRWVVQSNLTNVTPLYANGLTGAGQVIGICDSRLDFNHCAFADAQPFGPTHRKIIAYNATVMPFASHGTHVCGIACGDDGSENENRGIAYGAKLVYAPIPSFNLESVTAAFSLHHSQGARIHTNSWGDDGTTQYTSLCRGIDAFMAANEDDLVVFAVTNTATLRTPENCKNALAVGATQSPPAQDQHCFGGAGPTSDGRIKPEVFAPGCNIQSAMVNSGCATFAQSGTSMAAPAVAGVATLVRQYFTQGYYPDGSAGSGAAVTPSGALMKAVILNSAVDMAQYAGTIPNSSEGWGRVRAGDALYFPGDTRRLFVSDVRSSAGLTTGGVVESTVTFTGSGEPLRATLVWTDPAAAAGAALAPVNNLDLEVIAPDATMYRGNMFVNGESQPGGAADTLNNVEQVLVITPAAGVWTFRVRGTAVNQGLQGYALVVTGALQVPPTGLRVQVNPPAPLLIPPDTHQQFTVSVDPGDDSLTGAAPALLWRTSGAGTFSESPLFPLGGTQYRATLPRLACGDSPQYFVRAQGAASGVVTAPPNAPAASPFSPVVGVQNTATLLQEDFESGLPAGWSATDLWHVTTSCAQLPACDGTRWAYFGFDGACNYASAVRQVGTLTAPSIALPVVGPCGSITLTYCSFLVREQAPNFDLARLFVNGVLIDQPTSNTTLWTTRSVDLTPFAGQSVTLAWSFDTVDNFVNNFLGWQVDNVRITASDIGCNGPVPCPADISGDRHVTTQDLTMLLLKFGQSQEAFTQGDLNGDGLVNTSDLTLLLLRFGQDCP